MGRFVRILDSLAGIGFATEFERALLSERFDVLKRQLPWLYAIISVSVVCVQLVAGGERAISLLPAAILLAVIAGRAAHIRCVRKSILSAEAVRDELRKTFIVASAFFLLYSLWAGSLFLSSGPEIRGDVAMLAGLAAIGASCGLAGFPAAARIPLLLLGIPFGVALILEFVSAHAGIGACLIILSLINLRMVKVRDEAFTRLISSRLLVEAEKRRALDAEAAAISEKTEISDLANTDPLTGVANRRGFLGAIDSFDDAHRRKLGLILLDLDGFKPINDTFGHATGDALLVQVSERLRPLAAPGAPVARLGGDEFAIVCDCGGPRDAIAIAEQAVAVLSRPFRIDGRNLTISACAGVSYEGEADVGEAARRADIALFDAKKSGRGSVALFSEDMEREVQRRTAIEQALRDPALPGSIGLSFQPIFRLDRMELIAFEALARWRHPELGWISPSEFIPITEQISVLDEISYELLRCAANVACEWPEHVRLSFNLSPVELCSAETASRVLQIIGNAGLDPRRLHIEVTETALLADFALARRTLSTLGAKGVRIVLDDFGAGYSSISYLREMSFDAVKLDGSLIASAAHPGSGRPLLRGVLALCRAMGQDCIAEHIETDGQLELLRALGCRYGQGFGLAAPMSAADARQLALDVGPGGTRQQEARLRA